MPKINISPKTTKGILLILLSAFLYSIMPVLIRMLGASGIPPVSQVFLRYIAAFASAAVYFFFLSKGKIQVHKKDIPLLLVATVVGYALTNLFFTYGILYTQISNALFLFYSFAIIAPVLGFIFLKDKVNAFNIISLTFIFIALALLFQPNSVATWRIGGVYAILAAFAQAVYLITRKKLPGYPANFMMFANTLVGVIVLGALSFVLERAFYFDGGIARVTPNTWLTTALFGIDNFLAWLVMTRGFEYLKASTGSIVLLSELVFSIIFAFFFFREVPTVFTAIGGILILVASVTVILNERLTKINNN